MSRIEIVTTHTSIRAGGRPGTDPTPREGPGGSGPRPGRSGRDAARRPAAALRARRTDRILGRTRVRLRASWLLAPVYFIFARPSPALIATAAPFALAGLAVRAWAASVIHKNQTLATSGPYAYTRNPLYVGSFLIGTGLAIAGGRIAFFAVLVAFFLLVYRRVMRREANRLERLFGDEYRAYAAEVPVFLPRFRPWAGAGGVASVRSRFKRYMANREYQAAIGLLLGFLALGAKLVWF